jgi:hypothetical protein
MCINVNKGTAIVLLCLQNKNCTRQKRNIQFCTEEKKPHSKQAREAIPLCAILISEKQQQKTDKQTNNYKINNPMVG